MRDLHWPDGRTLAVSIVVNVEEGYTYHMDDLSDDVPHWEGVAMPDGSTRPLVVVPYALDTNDMKFWTDPAYSPAAWLDYARNSFDWLLAESRRDGARMLSIGLHLRIIGRPGRIWALEALLDHICAAEGVWVTSRKAIAGTFAAQFPWEDAQ